MNSIFYKPENAWAGDFIPFCKDGEFRLFYLHDWRNIDQFGEGVPWYQIGTKDFVHFTEYGEMLSRGTKDEQDLYVFTGSVIEAEGSFHIFYTGHNGWFPGLGRPAQAVMHAVSDDLLHWTKVPGDIYYSPSELYEPNDWRDPFVFWNDEAGEYWMLVAARHKSGPDRRRGVTAYCASKDLKKWEVRGDFYAPGLYYTHECPDLFQMGGWWYLVFSEYTDKIVTRYRMAKSVEGPWLAPRDDTFDGRGYYAAKTWSDGSKRYLFGWIPTREDGQDYNPWNWGGNLAVHELTQNADGTLAVKAPAGVSNAFGRGEAPRFTGGTGRWHAVENGLSVEAEGSYSCALSEDVMPGICKISADISFSNDTKGFGFMLRSDSDADKGYYVRLEPQMNRMVFDSWPRKEPDKPFMLELERPVCLSPEEPVHLDAYIDHTICVVYLNNAVAMSARMYNIQAGLFGVFASEGSVVFSNVELCHPIV
jgi:beta-fructofuranosidase